MILLYRYSNTCFNHDKLLNHNKVVTLKARPTHIKSKSDPSYYILQTIHLNVYGTSTKRLENILPV